MDPDLESRHPFDAFFGKSDTLSIVATMVIVGIFGVSGLVSGFGGDANGFRIAFWAAIIEIGAVVYAVASYSYARRHRDL